MQTVQAQVALANMQVSTVQYSTVQYSTVQLSYSLAQLSEVIAYSCFYT